MDAAHPTPGAAAPIARRRWVPYVLALDVVLVLAIVALPFLRGGDLLSHFGLIMLVPFVFLVAPASLALLGWYVASLVSRNPRARRHVLAGGAAGFAVVLSLCLAWGLFFAVT